MMKSHHFQTIVLSALLSVGGLALIVANEAQATQEELFINASDVHTATVVDASDGYAICAAIEDGSWDQHTDTLSELAVRYLCPELQAGDNIYLVTPKV